MVVRFALSVGAMAIGLGLLSSQLSQTLSSAPAPSTSAASPVASPEANSTAAMPVVIPVEDARVTTAPVFRRVVECSLAMPRSEVKPVQHVRPVSNTKAQNAEVSGGAGNVSVQTVGAKAGNVSDTSNRIRHEVELDALAFDEHLSGAAHLLSRAPVRVESVEAILAPKSRKPRAIPVAEASKTREIIEDLESALEEAELEVAAPEKVELSPRMQALKERLETTLSHYEPKLLNTRDHGHWATMHSLIAFGVDKQLRLNSPSGRKVNAIGWIAWNGVCAGERLFYLRNGKIHSRTGPGLQGHHGQFLCMLAQSRVRADYPMKIGGKDFTIADLIRREQETCVPRSELTFKLIGLAHYLDSEEQWKDEQGRNWSISRMVKEELAQPIVGAACGGTHRLFGLTYAIQKRAKQGHPIEGQFKRAEMFLADYKAYTFKLQNQDGSYSTQFFAARGADSRVMRRLETTGHIAEWLTLLLNDEELQEDHMVKSIEYLSGILYEGRDRYWKVGPLGHGLHALNMYHQRVFGEKPETPGPIASDSEPVRTAAKPKAS